MSQAAFFDQDLNVWGAFHAEFASANGASTYHRRLTALEAFTNLESYHRQTGDPRLGQFLEEATELAEELRQRNEEDIETIRTALIRTPCTMERRKLLRQIRECTGEELKAGARYYQTTAIDDFWIRVAHALPGDTHGQEEMAKGLVHHEISRVGLLCELITCLPMDEATVFYDIGSGSGVVPLFINLFTGARAKGLEIQTELCDYSMRLASYFGLSNVEAVNADALEANMDDGDIFYMFSPFYGDILDRFIDKLERLSRSRSFIVVSFGQSSPVLARAPFLRIDKQSSADPFRLALFRTI